MLINQGVFSEYVTKRVITFKKLQGINPIGLSAPWSEFLEIIALYPLKNARDNNSLWVHP